MNLNHMKLTNKKSSAAAASKKLEKPKPTHSAMKKAAIKKLKDPYAIVIKETQVEVKRINAIIAQCLWCAYGVDLRKIVEPLGYKLRDCRSEGGACEVPESFLKAKSITPASLDVEDERIQSNFKSWVAQKQRAALFCLLVWAPEPEFLLEFAL